MANQRASAWVITRDVLIAALDIAGDWTYFFFLYFGETSASGYVRFDVLIYSLFTLCCLGSIVSAWAIATSLGRGYRYKSLCCKCTVPRLSMSLILVHHVPQFVMTSYIDLTFNKTISWAGWFNIGSSMLALINTLFVTKCGDGYCFNNGDDENLEMSTYTDGDPSGVSSDYRHMAGTMV